MKRKNVLKYRTVFNMKSIRHCRFPKLKPVIGDGIDSNCLPLWWLLFAVACGKFFLLPDIVWSCCSPWLQCKWRLISFNITSRLCSWFSSRMNIALANNYSIRQTNLTSNIVEKSGVLLILAQMKKQNLNQRKKQWANEVLG